MILYSCCIVQRILDLLDVNAYNSMLLHFLHLNQSLVFSVILYSTSYNHLAHKITN